ncbi:opsin-VA-like [Pectinophora gossypiella]|uniref:opsin-VA-like n=1 Tax=Pectinophora gossypiella TaxID=13191 RepID=UPI00214EB5F9|nr:opsin-VA-like [Pectinophora gossypiella]
MQIFQALRGLNHDQTLIRPGATRALKMTSRATRGLKMTSLFNDSFRPDPLDYHLLMPEWAYTISAFALFLIGFFGFFLNLMVILLMCKDRQLWTPLNIILFNLVCADFSVSILGNPFTLVSALFHRWVFGKTMCVLYGFFMALLGITSITSLTVISFERYLMVTRPLSCRHLTPRGALLSILFIWSYSLALTTPPLMGWGNYVNEAANISCSVNWHEQSTNSLTYILFLFAMGQIFPFAVISFSYANIIYTMKKNSQRLGRVNRAEARATAMVFLMIVAFTVAWTPYSIFALIEQFGTQGTISPGAGVIPALVAKSSICYDPLIYVGMNTQFRQSIKRLFGIHTKDRTSLAERRHNQTMTSPGPRMTSINDIISNHEKKSRKVRIAEEIMVSEVNNVEIYRPLPAKTDLSTIQESRPTSDNERSGETTYDEDRSSSSGGKKQDLASQALLDSPVLTVMNPERTIFTRNGSATDNVTYSTYGNPAYEEHASDVTDNVGKVSNMSHSYSLDLSEPKGTARRKLSVEAKYDVVLHSKGFLKDSAVCKFFDQSCSGHDSFKSYLCPVNSSSDGDIL